MSKAIVKMASKKKELSLENIKKTLGEDHACYVLITCSSPSNSGHMNVEMTYEGDETLASFLVANASQIFEQKASQIK